MVVKKTANKSGINLNSELESVVYKVFFENGKFLWSEMVKINDWASSSKAHRFLRVRKHE